MPELLLSPVSGLSKSQLAKTTATVSDVIIGKKFYDANGNIATGTLVEQSAYVQSVDNPYMYEGVLCVNFPLGAYRTKVSGQTGSQVQVAQSNVASAIGLTAGMLVSGQSCLGITGTGSTAPNITAINQSGGWGEGTILSSWGCWTGLTNNIRMAFHWRAESDYNVNGFIRFMKDGYEVAAQEFSKGNGFVDKSFNSPGNYNVQIRVDYHAGNGTFYIGGMFVGY